MRYFLSITGIIASFALLKYRERVGDVLGDADWMQKIGGVYNFVILLALFIFFWSLAELTGTTAILFGWIRYLLPEAAPAPVGPVI